METPTGSAGNNGVTRRRIFDEQDLRLFLESNTFKELWSFILQCNMAVRNKPNSSATNLVGSPGVNELVQVLGELSKMVDDTPPLNQPTRFGNKAFRTWHEKLTTHAPDMMRRCLPEDQQTSAEELATYLSTSFGNETRIDYGSGHEGTFVVLLYCLAKIGVFTDKDLELLVLRVYRKYLEVTRKLQTTYYLEPAGSHGVWGLDDYSFVNFLWGSSQLHDNTQVSARSVVRSDQVLADYADEYLYIDAIRVIKQMKKGPFFEHSPMLRDISEVREGWPKINTGMIKMYRAEVWGKRQVVQHLLFGGIFDFE